MIQNGDLLYLTGNTNVNVDNARCNLTVKDWNGSWNGNLIGTLNLLGSNTFKDKTKKLFTYEQQKRICKFLKIKLESTLTEISYDGWLYLYDVFLKFVSNEKKAIILNAEQDMKNNQNKIQKKHRNRNHGYWKFEAKRQKKLKFENGK